MGLIPALNSVTSTEYDAWPTPYRVYHICVAQDRYIAWLQDTPFLTLTLALPFLGLELHNKLKFTSMNNR